MDGDWFWKMSSSTRTPPLTLQISPVARVVERGREHGLIIIASVACFFDDQMSTSHRLLAHTLCPSLFAFCCLLISMTPPFVPSWMLCAQFERRQNPRRRRATKTCESSCCSPALSSRGMAARSRSRTSLDSIS